MATNYPLAKIEKIYPSRQDALNKLSTLSFDFGTIVSIRYEKTNDSNCHCHCPSSLGKVVCELLVSYLSDTQGDYFIFADSNIPIGENGSNGKLVVYQGTISNGQNPQEAITAALFGIDPEENNIVILVNKEEGVNESYIYLKRKWVCIGKEQAPIQFAEGQFSWNEISRELKINTIYGGSF